MITLEQRIDLLVQLGHYLQHDPEWAIAKANAKSENAWFVEPFIELASVNVINEFLDARKLSQWVAGYNIRQTQGTPKKVGLVMAGNIPLVGFHDFLCGFISGHTLIIKPSSKDRVLIKQIIKKLSEWDHRVAESVVFAERLKGCDAYIATGSNNSGRYFEYYFRNYPSIIRKNRTSVAILTGNETNDDLDKLADDMLLYFGFGCRNVSKIYVPRNYDFIPLLNALDKYKWMEDHSKFKNNYDYNLSLYILNHQYYMTNGTVLLIENAPVFSPISQINFEYYDGKAPTDLLVKFADQIQCIIGNGYTPFGRAQSPALSDYADGVDTMHFLFGLS
jgi:hypothetical protein